jgi:hypothetical protein
MTVTSSTPYKQRDESLSGSPVRVTFNRPQKRSAYPLSGLSAGPGRAQPIVDRGLREDEAAPQPYVGNFTPAQRTARRSLAQPDFGSQSSHGWICALIKAYCGFVVGLRWFHCVVSFSTPTTMSASRSIRCLARYIQRKFVRSQTIYAKSSKSVRRQ